MPFKYSCELILLSALWGASFLFMRTTVDEFGPVMLVTLRTAIASLVLLPLLLRKNRYQVLTTHWRPILFVGLTNTALPFILFSYSTLYISAGFASILNATAPFFGALVGFFWLKDKLSSVATFGMLLGFAGVICLSYARVSLQAENTFLPILAALGATFLYGLAACYTKRFLLKVDVLTVVTGSQCFSALVLIPISAFFLPAVQPSLSSWMQLLILALFCTAFAYVLYFHLIANIGVAKAITVAYLVPVFGVFWGMVFLAESLTVGMWVGAAMVLAGVALTTGLKRKLKVAQ